ncbi:MAG: tetratricopeptide repeat protein [Chloroflexota bacterium]
MDDARDLRQRGIQLAKAGQKDESRELLQQSIRLDPQNEAAWLWLASVARDNRERLFCLQKLLEINPQNETARKALDAANQTQPPASTVRRLPNAPDTKTQTQEVMSQTPGVPVPMPDRIAEAQKQADALVREYLTPPASSVKWVHKTSRRAGERDIIVFRMYVAGAILGVLFVLFLGGVVLVQTNDDVRGIVLGPSLTPTPSPTITPTNTPGLTPTPSATPRLTPTPSATPPPNLLAASPPAFPRVTAVYPQILERAVFDAAMLLEQGSVAQAMPTLERERERSFDTRLNPSSYYYQALGFLAQNRVSDALDALDEAYGRIGESPGDTWIRPFLDSGYAQAYWAQVQQATTNGNPTLAEEAATQMNDHAQAAITADRRLAPPYLVLAQFNARSSRFSDALEILNQGLQVPELASNTELIMAKANIYLTQRSYDQALYQAYLALYIDPSTEAAYELKIQIALARNRPGDAVLTAQDYLYFFPGSTKAFRLLGDAHVAEGSDDLALEAYTQGLAGDGTDPDAQRMLEARGGIYQRQRRYDRAFADYNRLYEINGEPRVQLLRMRAAFDLDDFDQVVADAQALSGNESVDQVLVSLVYGSALVERAQDSDTALNQQAAQLLTQAVASAPNADLRGSAYEYLARAQLNLGQEDAAADSISAALNSGESGSRHFWSGRIHEALNQETSAMRDYEWVLAWSEIFPFPFRVDAETRLDALRGAAN